MTTTVLANKQKNHATATCASVLRLVNDMTSIIEHHKKTVPEAFYSNAEPHSQSKETRRRMRRVLQRCVPYGFAAGPKGSPRQMLR